MNIIKSVKEKDQYGNDIQVDYFDNGFIVKSPVSYQAPVAAPPQTIEERLKAAEEKQALMQAVLDDRILGGAL